MALSIIIFRDIQVHWIHTITKVVFMNDTVYWWQSLITFVSSRIRVKYRCLKKDLKEGIRSKKTNITEIHSIVLYRWFSMQNISELFLYDLLCVWLKIVYLFQQISNSFIYLLVTYKFDVKWKKNTSVICQRWEVLWEHTR